MDTHIFIWWVNNSARLEVSTRERIEREPEAIALSAISLWETAKLVQSGRLELPLEDWLEQALAYPKVVIVPLSPAIAIGSPRLPQPFHEDPADQIIVASARVLGCGLLTYDGKIRQYPHVLLAE